MHSTKKNTLILALLIMYLCATGSTSAIDLSASGGWSPIIGPADLAAGPGSGLNSIYQSNPDQVLVSISNSLGFDDSWRVDVRRSDTNWDSDLALSVKRSGNGVGSGSVLGGDGYQAINMSDVAFFSGGGNRSDIPIEIQISGVSIAIPPGTYSTSIVLTVVDTQ